MSTTISSHQSHHMPLVASLSVLGVIAAAGVVGVAFHESASPGSPDPAPAVSQPRPGADQNARIAERQSQSQPLGYDQYGHYYGGQPVGGGSSQLSAGGGKTVD